MIFVNRKTISHPEVFFSNEIKVAQQRLEEFYNRSRESRSQEKYSKPFEPELRDKFLKALREVFNGKCAYCESLISLITTTSEYDHFRPKSGARGLENEFSNEHYWWLTYEWNNLYYSCQICNRYKSTWFPVAGSRIKIKTPYPELIKKEKPLLIDPCIDKPEAHLVYSENGQVDFLSPKGKTTIEILKLNRSELVNSREETLKELFSQWELMLKLFSKKAANRSKLKNIGHEWERLFNDDNNSKPYLAIQRQMLSKWLENHLDIQAYFASKEYDSPDDLKIPETKSIPVTQSIEALNKKEELSSDEKEKIDNELQLDSVKHIYVEKIELKNFKCFSHLEIDLAEHNSTSESKITDSNPLVEPWMLFLGENGVGKSSVLKALVIGLCGTEYINDLKILGGDILKHGSKKGYIKIHLVGGVKPIEVHFSDKEIVSTLLQPIVNLVAYNSIRLMPKKGKLSPERGIFYGARAKNLFDYTVSLIDADNWLLTRSKKIFDRAALTLKDLMLLEEEDRIEKNDEKIIIRRGNDVFSIDELSDGYQSLYALAIDIMATLVKENVTFDLAEGMVLIDEIGTHLHPRWRMEIIERLRNAFPKIRFIVTTHEPLCLRGLKAGETIVLTKNIDKEIIALTDLPDPSELRIDQILTSDFFGLKSTIDPQTEKLFQEYYFILALDETERTGEQKNRLLELNELIPKIKHLGDTLREELIYYVVDELLAKKTRKDGLKIKAKIQEEAIKRVEGLWNLISTEKN